MEGKTKWQTWFLIHCPSSVYIAFVNGEPGSDSKSWFSYCFPVKWKCFQIYAYFTCISKLEDWAAAFHKDLRLDISPLIRQGRFSRSKTEVTENIRYWKLLLIVIHPISLYNKPIYKGKIIFLRTCRRCG